MASNENSLKYTLKYTFIAGRYAKEKKQMEWI